MAYRILLRRDTSSNWTGNNPVLASGEPGFESDTNRLKVGNGTSQWSDLNYYMGTTGATGATGSVLPYTECVMTLTQSSSTAPVITQIYNNTGLTFSSNYQSTGYYNITSSSDFVDQNKVLFFLSPIYMNGDYVVTMQQLNSNSITLYSTVSGVVRDGGLNNTPLSIRIYP